MILQILIAMMEWVGSGRVTCGTSPQSPGRGHGYPAPSPTDRRMRISRTTLFRACFTTERCYPVQYCCHGALPSWLCVQHAFSSLCRDHVSLSRCMLCGPLPHGRGSPALRVLWVRPTSYGSSREACVAHAYLAVTGPACGLYREPQDLPSPRRFLGLRAVGLHPGRASIDSPCSAYAGAAFPCGGQGRPLRPRSISGL